MRIFYAVALVADYEVGARSYQRFLHLYSIFKSRKLVKAIIFPFFEIFVLAPNVGLIYIFFNFRV